MPMLSRQDFLRTLESVQPGLAAKEVLNQATCLVFNKGRVFTFNDEIACNAPLPTAITGAVPATKLLELLRKMQEDTVDVTVEKGQLCVKGKGRRAGITMEADITLPFDSVEVPTDWHPIGPEVLDAIEVATSCTAQQGDEFILKSLHITPTHIEACDNFRAVRYTCTIPGITNCLVQNTASKHLIGCGMSEISQTQNWLHWRNPLGLVISCRLIKDAYTIDIAKLMARTGTVAKLPPTLGEAADKAVTFSDSGDDVTIDLKQGALRVRTADSVGWYEEQRQVEYAGGPVTFMISTALLKACLLHSTDIEICEGALKIVRPSFTFLTSSKVPG